MAHLGTMHNKNHNRIKSASCQLVGMGVLDARLPVREPIVEHLPLMSRSSCNICARCCREFTWDFKEEIVSSNS